MTIQINQASAIKAYNEAPKDVKKVLETLFGKEQLSQKITDRVKTFDDAIGVLIEQGLTPPILNYPGDDKDLIAADAFLKLTIIAKALNEGWTPDWTDSDQYKYYPWFEYKSGVGFSYDAYGYWVAGTVVGSRLCYKSRELAEYAGKQFQSLYNEFLNL